jgi:hypothetical protein
MSDTSLGPGWWLASDGKWYPPRWEYQWFSTVANPRAGFRGPDLNAALQEAIEKAASLGAQGWEMVNFTTQWVGDETGPVRGTTTLPHWTVVCFLKRPRLS